MAISFHRPKPQPEHTAEELAQLQRIPVGATSNTPLHLWDLRKLQGTRLDEVLDNLLLEPGE